MFSLFSGTSNLSTINENFYWSSTPSNDVVSTESKFKSLITLVNLSFNFYFSLKKSDFFGFLMNGSASSVVKSISNSWLSLV